MKFKSAYSESSHTFAPSGSKFRTKFIKQTTSGELIEDGVENVYDSIQKASVGIAVPDLIRRAKNGDITAIGEPLDSFGDVSRVPKDFIEAHMMSKDYEAKFRSLPLSLRKEYNNNFSDFLKALSDGSLKDKLKLENKSNVASPTVSPLSASELESVRKILGGNNNA